MGKLSAFAERMADTKARLELEVDKLTPKLDAIDTAAPKAFDHASAFLDAQQAEVNEIESTLRQLSNLPFGSGRSPEGSEKPVDASKPNGPSPGPSGGAATPGPFPADPSAGRT